MKKKGNDLICIRPDAIVEARFKLNKKQNDIMDMVFATIQDDDNLEYEIDVAKYAKLYKLQNQSNVYGEIKKTVKTFEGKGFKLLCKDVDREEFFTWFSRISYLNGEGRIIVELGKTLKSLFLDVKRAAFYKIEYSLNFNSVYSKRLYYYLKLFEDTGFRIDNIEVLREKLNCPSGYKNFADFNRYVLKPAYEEINGSSDICFEYESQKTGKKVTHVKFYIKSNKKPNDPKSKQVESEVVADKETPLDAIENDIKAIMDLTNNEFSEKTIVLFIGLSNGDIGKIKKLYDYMNTKNIQENRTGYMRKLLKDWEEPKQSKGNNSYNSYGTGFNNFEPREYDYNSLEKRLLGWDD